MRLYKTGVRLVVEQRCLILPKRGPSTLQRAYKTISLRKLWWGASRWTRWTIDWYRLDKNAVSALAFLHLKIEGNSKVLSWWINLIRSSKLSIFKISQKKNLINFSGGVLTRTLRGKQNLQKRAKQRIKCDLLTHNILSEVSLLLEK